MKKYIFPAFILVCLIQIYVPAKMIWNQEDILRTGVEYKFRAAPVDPNDPFRGKYLDVNFQPSEYPVEDASDWYWGQEVYVHLGKDSEGYFTIEGLSVEPPENVEYLKAEVASVIYQPQPSVFINYPFNRFYMKESKALPAENLYRETLRDSSKTAYALISIKEGNAVFKDLMIDGVSIRKLR